MRVTLAKIHLYFPHLEDELPAPLTMHIVVIQVRQRGCGKLMNMPVPNNRSHPEDKGRQEL